MRLRAINPRTRTRTRTVPMTDGDRYATLTDLNRVHVRDINDLDELELDDTVRAELATWAGQPMTSLVEVVIHAPAAGGKRSSLIAPLGIMRVLAAVQFTDHGIALRLFTSETALVELTGDGELTDPTVITTEIDQVGAQRFLPYQGLGVTRTTSTWVTVDALAGDRGLALGRWPERSFPVDPDLLGSDEVRAKLNTFRRPRAEAASS